MAGPNFGTGSSREHAVWALMDHGLRAVISPRFGDIFRNNSTKNGLVPVVVPPEVGEQLLRAVEVYETDPVHFAEAILVACAESTTHRG